MLNKPLAHIRPLLRLPSHPAPSPEHFTPNPSLLHHLPPNGVGNAVVSQAQSSAQAAGSSSSGAGRAGYGSGNAGAGNGGYTGHARAFLSLPQISGTGPTSSLTSDENSRSESSTSARRSNLLLKHRLAKHTRLIQAPQEGVGRGVRREIEARAGSSRLGVVEIDYDAEKASAALLLEDGPSSPSRSRRRSSIAFPTESASPSRSHGRTPLLSPRPLIPRTPAHSRSSTPILPSSQPEPLQRSKTSLELWHVGRPYSRSQLSIRALSTQSESKPLPDIDIDVLPVRSSTPPPRKPVLQQPTRVLMDLAGIDLPILGRRAGQVRRNSTTAIQETAEADDSMSNAYEELPEEEADVQEKAAEVINEDRSRDFEIYKAISEAQRSGQRDSVERLVAYYRSPREASPFAPPRETQQLCDTLPVPPGWTHMTYNMCLDAIITVRSPGDSIAPILEVYNEMLERDLVPNKMTYQHVIRALCYRERDVWAAVSQWEDEKRWGRWMAQSFGTEWDEEKSAEKDHIMEGYKAESNVDSAVKLFRAASLARGQQKYLRAVYFSIIEAVAKQPEPNLDVMMEVFRQSQRAGALGSRALYAHIFKSFGSAKNVEGLRQLWDEYEQTEKEGKGKHDREWITENIEVNLRSSTIPERRLLGFCRTAWSAAMQAFVAAGKPEIALELLDKMLASPVLVREVVPDLTIPPHPTTQTLGELVMVLAESGYIDKALDLYPRAMEIIRSFGHYATASSHFFRFTDALILAGKWREAVQLMCARNEALRAHGVEEGVGADLLRLRRLYAAVLAEARKADPAEAVQILAHVPHFTSSPDPPEKSDLAETPPSEAESSGSGLVALNPTLFTAHCDLLLKLGRYDEIAPLLDYFKVDKRPSRWFLGPIAKRITKTDVSFFELCRIWSAMELHRVSPNASAGQGLIAKYFDERNKVASALDLPLASEDWFRMLISFAGLPPTKLNDGDYDEQIIRFMDDLHEVKTKKPDSFDVFLPTKHAKTFANILIGRFGRERATQMLAGTFGESSAQTLVPVIPQESQSDASTETVSEIFSIPPTPGSLSSASEGVSESPVAAGMNLYVDPLINDWVDAHARRGTKLSARDCYTFLLHGLSRGAVALPDILSKLIVNLAREGHEPLARKVYVLAQQVLASVVPPQQQPAAWADVEDGMLMACCHLGYLEQAGMHRARIVEAGMAPSADSYATMISCSKDTTDDALVARELFDESRAMGVKPNLFLYNTIISKLSKARKAEMALELFKHMSVSGLSPSSVTYGAVINACCRVGDGESAATLFDEMSTRRDFRPRVPPYNTMMQFHLTTEPSRERVLHYFRALRAHGVPPSAHTYKLLLDTFAVLQPTDLPAMERVFADLCADPDVKVQGTHWASIIAAYGIYGNDMAKAIETFESIPMHPSTRDPRTAAEPGVWEAILSVISAEGTLEDLETMRQRMVASGVKGNAYVNNVLISGYARAGEIEKAREVFESMGDSVTGVAAPNNHPTLLTSSGHVKPSTVTAEPTHVVYREPSTYESMIRAELRAGTREAAEAVCARMEERRYPVAVYMRGRAVLDEQVMTGEGPMYSGLFHTPGYPTMPASWQVSEEVPAA